MKKILLALLILSASCQVAKPKYQPAFSVGYGLILSGNGGKTYPYVLMLDTNQVSIINKK